MARDPAGDSGRVHLRARGRDAAARRGRAAVRAVAVVQADRRAVQTAALVARHRARRLCLRPRGGRARRRVGRHRRAAARQRPAVRDPARAVREGHARHEPRDGPGGRGDARPRPLCRRRFTRGRCVAGVDDGLDRGGHVGGCRGDRADDRGSRREQRRDAARLLFGTRDGHALRAHRRCSRSRPSTSSTTAIAQIVHALAAVRARGLLDRRSRPRTRARSRPVTSRPHCRRSRS